MCASQDEDDDESSAGEKEVRWQGDDSHAIWKKASREYSTPEEGGKETTVRASRRVEWKYLIIFHGIGEGICCVLTSWHRFC